MITIGLVDLAADAGAGLGLFERLPPQTSAGAFADRLRSAGAANHGTAFPAFLRALVADIERARNYRHDGIATLADELGGHSRMCHS